MDIKYVWVVGKFCYVYVLMIIDIFICFVLYWVVGYVMKQEQIKDVWDQVIVKYLQLVDLFKVQINVEICNDNGK